MSKRYSQPPSALLHVDDSYAAYCLDEACMYALCRIEQDGRLPDTLCGTPDSNRGTLERLRNMRGVSFVDKRRNNRGVSYAVDG